MSETPKFCKDCKHHWTGTLNQGHWCLNDDISGPPSLVTGERKRDLCQEQRDTRGKCGPEAKHFEAQTTAEKVGRVTRLFG